MNIQFWVLLHLQVQPVDPTASRRHAAQESLGVGSWRVCLSHRRCDRVHWYINQRRGRLAWLLELQALTSPFCCDLTAPSFETICGFIEGQTTAAVRGTILGEDLLLSDLSLLVWWDNGVWKIHFIWFSLH